MSRARPRRRDPALAELVQLVGRKRVAALADAGALASVAGVTCVVFQAREDVLARDVALVAWVPDRVAVDAASTRRVRARFRAVGLRDVAIRLTARQLAERPDDGTLRVTYLRRAGAAPARAPAGVVVRAAEDDADRGFARDLLLDALRAGTGIEPEVGPDPGTIAGVAFEAAVAEVEGRLVGHASWASGCEDELTGERFTELLDVTVLPEWRGRGVTELLVARVADAAGSEPVLGSVVRDGSGAHVRLLSSLVGSGAWRAAYGYCDDLAPVVERCDV